MSSQLPSLLEAAEKLPPRELDAFAKQIVALRARHVAPVLSKDEASLLNHIQQVLPAELRMRHASLLQKQESEDLSDTEREELRGVTAEYERRAVERLQYIIQLAALRRQSVQELMDELDLNLPASV